MSKIVMLIASSMFRDEELFETKEELERRGHRVTVASSKLGTCQGSHGRKAESELLLEDIRPEDFDAIVYVGGAGTSEYFDNKLAHDLAGAFLEQGKILSAICIAPVILANAGLLKGVKATVYPSGKEDLTSQGALYEDRAVVRDGRIITGNGPAATIDFATAISEELGRN